VNRNETLEKEKRREVIVTVIVTATVTVTMGNAESKSNTEGVGGVGVGDGDDPDATPTPVANKGGKKKAKLDVVFVDDDPELIKRSVGFSPGLFINGEFNTLKKFCNSRKLHQYHLNYLFKRYLSSEDVYLRDFRVRVLDLKEEFDDMSLLYREICEIFVPMLYQKEFRGLGKAHSLDEVTFPRFVVLSYIFCAQPLPDLFFEMFMILKQKFTIKHTATMYAYNIEQITKTLTEELDKTATLTTLLRMLKELPPDKE
jgi:hypothetical protein